MKLLWAQNGFGIGPSYGMSMHRKKLREALEAAGVRMTFDPNDNCDLAIHTIRQDFFKPIPGKINLLFAACEFSHLHALLAARPDVLVVPCAHNKEVYAQHFDGSIHICPEGVDENLFPFYQRKAPGPDKPFRFLWLGNALINGKLDTRKGLDIMLSAWKLWTQLHDFPQDAELYVKTTGAPGPEVERHEGRGPIVMDGRNLSGPDLAALYNSAHTYVSTSFGEGWGLCNTEAMATGLPCVWTHYSGMVDYADESTGFPITDFTMEPFWRPENAAKFGIGEPDYYGARASEASIVRKMQAIYRDYPAALAKGKKASERMHGQFTWRQAAEKFIAICEKYIRKPAPVASGAKQ